MGPGIADARGHLQLVGDLEGAVGEQGDLPVVALGVVDIVVAVGQQLLAPGVHHALAPQVLGQLRQLRVVDLLDAALGVVAQEHPGDPGQAGVRIGGLQPEFLGEVLLLVGHRAGGRIGAEAGQVEPGGGEQRIRSGQALGAVIAHGIDE